MLHTVNKSPLDRNTLASCIRLAKPGSAILLIEDGVFGALETETNLELWQNCLAKTFVLQEDTEARGLNKNIAERFKSISYQEFVALTLEYNAVHAWY